MPREGDRAVKPITYLLASGIQHLGLIFRLQDGAWGEAQKEAGRGWGEGQKEAGRGWGEEAGRVD